MQKNVDEFQDQVSLIIFKVGNEEFVIDLLEVKEIIQSGQIRRLPRSFDFIEGIFNYRGNIIHIINLEKKLNLNEYIIYKRAQTTEKRTNHSKKFIIIVNINDTDIGFYVDRIINVVRVDMEQLVGMSPIFKTAIEDTDYIKGIVKFEDRPRIFINLSKILSEAEQLSIQKDQQSLF